jgi:polar amino acid transport system ATP-binding protein
MSDKQPAALVDIKNLRKSFGQVEVLKGINLSIQRKEVVCIIGKSGSGKSTLLRCINGLEVFQSGELLVAGQQVKSDDARAMRALRQKVGMVFQSFNLFPAMSAGRNIMLAPKLVKGMPNDAAKALAEKLLKRVGLADKFDSLPHELSGGQQQRVAIARALAMNPEVILCDEITSALDPELVGEVLQVIEALAEEGVTLIIATHEMNFARKVCDRIIFMHMGLVHEVGTPEEIFTAPRTPELRSFIAMK